MLPAHNELNDGTGTKYIIYFLKIPHVIIFCPLLIGILFLFTVILSKKFFRKLRFNAYNKQLKSYFKMI